MYCQIKMRRHRHSWERPPKIVTQQPELKWSQFLIISG